MGRASATAQDADRRRASQRVAGCRLNEDAGLTRRCEGGAVKMGRDAKSIDVYIEKGEKRIFAGAIDWPGWCRSGRDEESALQSLADYGPRYARALHAAKLKFEAPGDVDAF